MANRGRWFVMDVGDVDQDGDDDILLGSFYRSAHPKYAKLMEYWRQPGTGVMLLENTVKWIHVSIGWCKGGDAKGKLVA